MYLGKMISIRTKQHLSNIWGSIHYKCCLYKKYMRMNFRHIVFKLTPIKSVCESVSIELILHEHIFRNEKFSDIFLVASRHNLFCS